MTKLALFSLFAILCHALAENEFVPMLDGRIVGGKDTTIEEYPHQISMRYMWQHRCGGSIINEKMILSAAHCVDGLWFKFLLKIRAGTSNKKGGVDVGVDAIHVHENYKPATVDYDISLLILSESLTFSPSIQPVVMPNYLEKTNVGTEAFVTGWGATSEGGFSSSQLKMVQVNIVDHNECFAAYNKAEGANRITENMICAGRVGGGHDACQGDSGGPMVVFDENKNAKLVGIVSWGYGCARPDYPGVYAKVSQLRNWVEEKILSTN